jgi:hypothetical protein
VNEGVTYKDLEPLDIRVSVEVSRESFRSRKLLVLNGYIISYVVYIDKEMKKRILIGSLTVVIVVLALFVAVMLYSGDNGGGPVVGAAEYEVTFESTWSASTHPYNFPTNPHFSGLIGATHDSTVVFWKEGELASAGIKNVAEKGSKNPFDNEIDAAIAADTAFNKLSGGGIGTSPGSVRLTFQVSNAYPLVTLVSMIAPSPDWFVGVSGLSLDENGEWVSEKVVDLYLYDAGTDSGTDFTSRDVVTTPPVVIARINESVLAGSSVPYGTFTFTKK